jgi:DNA-binding CsgD family transcriptional regulator
MPSNTPVASVNRENKTAPFAEERAFAPPAITTRQLECLYWVQEGKSASDIGGILGISSRTVEGHLQKLCEHLGVKTRVQAVLKVRDLGLINPSTP